MNGVHRSTLLKVMSVTLAVLVVVMSVKLVSAATKDDATTPAAGDRVPLRAGIYAQQHTAHHPVADVHLEVGAPTTYLDSQLAEPAELHELHERPRLRAPNKGKLISISWRFTSSAAPSTTMQRRQRAETPSSASTNPA